MENKKLTLDDLLNALSNPEKSQLENTTVTWSRIGSKDLFEELGIKSSELEDFLKDWIASNPYSAL